MWLNIRPMLPRFMLLAVVAATPALAVLDTRALIKQALDEPAAITLDTIRLGDAIAQISEQTGVPLRMSDDTMALVPHGADTMIEHVEIANVPLRQGLTDLFAPLGMKFEVREDHVAIVPRTGLKCLARAPSWEELDTLNWLASVQPGIDEEARAALRARVQFRVPMSQTWPVLADALAGVGAGPGDEVLTVAADQLGWAWCVSDERIVITPMQDRIRQRLGQPVSIRMNNRPLFDVLQVLGDRLGVNIRFEPGLLASLPASMQRNFSINVHEQSGDDVLEMISAYTGLGYLIEPDGVLFYDAQGGPAPSSEPTAEPARPEAARDPYVAKLTVPLGDGRTVDWLIRRSELPPDLQQMRERDVAAAFEALRVQESRKP